MRRSGLICPGDNAELLQKLPRGAQDFVILELEDGVFETRKEIARQEVSRVLEQLDWKGQERLVRINEMSSAHVARDIHVIAKGRPDAILIPKVQTPKDVQDASALLAQAEREYGLAPGSIRIWAMIETAMALVNVEAIAVADPRMTALLFGAGDLGSDLRLNRIGQGASGRTGWPAYEYAYARGRVVAAARAAGIDPVDVGHAAYGDLETTRRAAEFSTQMGFSGAVVFSPRQIPVVNEVYSPWPEDVLWAHEVLNKYTAANNDVERTVVVIDGEMVDGPFVRNAKYILERETLVKEQEKASGI